ncbi:hypothetical protein R5R35_005117 [Gryllus longicercus]|uniref:Endosome-associated-trafficking regulator 1 n=1 Tax=Gryllus longicercus TaxID=2509291 RepID=A0AAN9VCR2_9ORTH
MAEGNEDENPYSFRSYNRKKEPKSNESSDVEECSNAIPDLGIGNQHDSEKRVTSNSSCRGSDMPKREENPFSFKHFLKRDSGSNYQSTGARPKIYNSVQLENVDHPELDVELETGLYGRSGTSRHVGTPELTSVLPDFVQDHLVVEQCYLNHPDNSNSPQLTVDLENLPDFAINNISPAQETSSPSKSSSTLRHWDELKSADNESLSIDIPFDLTGTTRNQHFPGRVRKNSGPVPLDLPSVTTDQSAPPGRQNGALPFDLPLVRDVDVSQAPASASGSRSGPPLGEVGVSKSLPDFLSDGPIHSGRRNDESVDPLSTCSSNVSRSPSTDDFQRLQVENERFRRELDISRRQLSEQARRIQFLEKEVCTMQSKEHEETASLEKAIEQVEDNLKRSTRRAVLAENQVSKLKQETKILLNELTQLRRENHELRTGQGLSIGVEPSHEQLTKKLSQDLRSAAGTAEVSLRQLLTGVENLRVIAATMESMHRIHDRTSDFLADHDDDAEDASASGGAGPAL